MAESFISSPEAPLLGELSAKQTERLDKEAADREPQAWRRGYSSIAFTSFRKASILSS